MTTKTSAKLTQVEFHQRFEMWKDVIDCRTEEEGHGKEPEGIVWNEAKFAEVLDTMREVIYAMSPAIINTHMATTFNEAFPNFTFGNG